MPDDANGRDAWDWPKLRTVALREARRVLDPDLAEDAAQEAVLRAWRNAGACSGRPEPWIRTIARREALRIVPRPIATPLCDDHETVGASDPIEPVELRLDLALKLRELRPQERQALFLRHWADRSGEEIAALLAIPLGTVKIRIHRAHKKLAGTTVQRPHRHGNVRRG